MTPSDRLQGRHRLLLWWYPKQFRREFGSELIDVFLEGARAGHRRAGLADYLDLVISGIRMRARPTSPLSERPAAGVVPLMYIGALLELVAAVTILATAGDIRAILVSQSPRFTEAQWAAVMASDLEPVAVAACVAAAVWLGLAWAIAHAYRWPRFVLLVFLGVNVLGLLSGLAQGSAAAARADLVVGAALCLVQCVAVGLVFPSTFATLARLRSTAGRTLALRDR